MTKNYNHIKWAKEMKENNPETLKDFSVLEIVEIWESYSERLAAGWISEYNEAVEMVFKDLTSKL